MFLCCGRGIKESRLVLLAEMLARVLGKKSFLPCFCAVEKNAMFAAVIKLRVSLSIRPACTGIAWIVGGHFSIT